MPESKQELLRGSLYPALHGVEDQGWLPSEWKESETGRQSKFYSLAKKRRRHRNAEGLPWQSLADALGFRFGAGESW